MHNTTAEVGKMALISKLKLVQKSDVCLKPNLMYLISIVYDIGSCCSLLM